MKFYILLAGALIVTGCTPISDPEIVVRPTPEKRPSKPVYMPPGEKPLGNPPEGKTSIPLAPCVGIRVPLDK